MSILREMAAKAKCDGECTVRWTTLRNHISTEPCLAGVAGKTSIQKLRAWAQRQGLDMDFDLDFRNFTSDINTVTLLAPNRSRSGR